MFFPSLFYFLAACILPIYFVALAFCWLIYKIKNKKWDLFIFFMSKKIGKNVVLSLCFSPNWTIYPKLVYEKAKKIHDKK